MVFPPSLAAGALPAVIDWLEAMSGRGDRSLRTPGFSAAAEQLPEHADQDIGGIGHGVFGPPGDVHVGPHHDAAVFVDFALPIPVGIDVLRIAARGADAVDVGMSLFLWFKICGPSFGDGRQCCSPNNQSACAEAGAQSRSITGGVIYCDAI